MVGSIAPMRQVYLTGSNPVISSNNKIMFPKKPKKRRSKYNTALSKKAKQETCQCLCGHIHNSRGEAGHCNNLYFRKKAKEIKDYKREVSFSFDINGKHLWNHIVDFLVTGWDDKQWVEEYKGVATEIWRRNYKLFKILYPEIPYKVIWHR